MLPTTHEFRGSVKVIMSCAIDLNQGCLEKVTDSLPGLLSGGVVRLDICVLSILNNTNFSNQH